MSSSRRTVNLIVAVIVLFVIVGIVIALVLFPQKNLSNKTVSEQEVKSYTNSSIESCTQDSDCGFYAGCQLFSNSELDLYAPCSYFAVVKPKCIDNRCSYKEESAIIDRCLPSCAQDLVMPKECFIPRDSSGDQSADAQCVDRTSASLTCTQPQTCKNIYNGNCKSIIGTCVN